jgi:hypothetical protein
MQNNFFGKTEGERSLNRARSRWGINIKKDLREIEYEVAELNHIARDRNQW